MLVVKDLVKSFPVRSGFGLAGPAQSVKALDGISFEVARGEALGLVGESGCGKSTSARTILRLTEPDSGTAEIDGADLFKATGPELRRLRRRVQIVFQDPYASLNPRRRIGDALAEPMKVHGIGSPKEWPERARALLAEVGLPAEAVHKYPHEFSGGQRQRIGIARALSVGPELLFLDEPVSALDVSVQAQVLVLLNKLRETRNLASVFISHDLGVVRYFCQRVAVMYLGRIVEQAPAEDLLDTPLHPYTQALRAATPTPDPAHKVTMARLVGDPASPLNPPPGCHFHPRCPHAVERCRLEAPALRDVAPGRKVACHLVA
jgi:oligopeptide/dipeptide ABC transporter ATP-binding protein